MFANRLVEDETFAVIGRFVGIEFHPAQQAAATQIFRVIEQVACSDRDSPKVPPPVRPFVGDESTQERVDKDMPIRSEDFINNKTDEMLWSTSLRMSRCNFTLSLNPLAEPSRERGALVLLAGILSNGVRF
jgi:hypothetical protein